MLFVTRWRWRWQLWVDTSWVMSILAYSSIVMGRSAICRCMSYWIQWFPIAMFYCFKLNETCFHTPGLWNVAVPRYRWCSKRSYHRYWENPQRLGKAHRLARKLGVSSTTSCSLGWKKDGGELSKVEWYPQKNREALSGYMGFKSFRNLYQILKIGFKDENDCQRWWFSTWKVVILIGFLHQLHVTYQLVALKDQCVIPSEAIFK